MEKLPDARRGTVFSLFPTCLPSFTMSTLLFLYPLSVYLPPSWFSVFPRSLILVCHVSSHSPILHRPLFATPSRSLHVITLLLSDMSLCYRHNQPAFSLSLFLFLSLYLSSLCISLLSCSVSSRYTLFAAPPHPRVICNVSYARAPPRSSAISAIILIFMPTPSYSADASSHSLFRSRVFSRSCRQRYASRRKANRKRIYRTPISLNCSTFPLIDPLIDRETYLLMNLKNISW